MEKKEKDKELIPPISHKVDILNDQLCHTFEYFLKLDFFYALGANERCLPMELHLPSRYCCI